MSQKAGDVDAGDNLTYSVDIKGGEKNLETASTGGSVVTDAEGNKVSVPVEVLSNTTENGIQTLSLIHIYAGADINHAATNPSIDGKLALDNVVDAEDKGSVTWSNQGQTGFAEGAEGQPLGALTVNPDGSYTYTPVSYTHLDVYKRQAICSRKRTKVNESPRVVLDSGSLAAGVYLDRFCGTVVFLRADYRPSGRAGVHDGDYRLPALLFI